MNNVVAHTVGAAARRRGRMVALLMTGFGVALSSDVLHAKIPGQTHCYNGICHRVLTVDETRAAVGKVGWVKASHYDSPDRDRYNPRLETSSGEHFRADRADNAASPIFPDGTKLLVWNPATGVAAAVRINNAGPYFPGRDLDVSRALAERLGFVLLGVAPLQIMVISAPTEEEARYRRGRHYLAVQGVLGRFASFDLAKLASDDAVVALLDDNNSSAATLLTSVAGWRRVVERVRRAREPAKMRVETAAVSAISRSRIAFAARPASTSLRHAAVDRSWTGRFYD